MRAFSVFACSLFLLKALAGQQLLEHGLRANVAYHDSGFSLKHDVMEVEVPFLVLDRTGQPVQSLTPKDVQLYDNDARVNGITSFVQPQQRPMQVGIMIDLSESMQSKRNAVAVESIEALQNFLLAGRDSVFLVGFSKKPQLLQPPTADVAQVRTAILAQQTRADLTSLYDSVLFACDQFPRDGSGRDSQRILVVYSDGQDNLSIHSLHDALRAATDAGITIYAVASDTDRRDGIAVLRKLTTQTGGELILLHKYKETGLLLAALRERAEGTYAMTFLPPDRKPGFHRLELRVAAANDVTIHARSGYFLRPPK